jgi:TolB-like protein
MLSPLDLGELISTRDDTLLWAESYERNTGDILALQADVARAIAAEAGKQRKTGSS